MLIGRVWICPLLFVCLFVNLSLCTVTDFSAGDKASGVKFCTMVHGRPGHGIGARFENVLFKKGHHIKGAGVWTPSLDPPLESERFAF